MKELSLSYREFARPLRAGRGVPIALGPAEERKARGEEKMPRPEVGRGSVKLGIYGFELISLK